MTTQKRVGVVLSGCGFLDGAEVHESVCTLLSLDLRGAEAVAFAPDVPQFAVIDHRQNKPALVETRSVLLESARIVRGAIAELGTARASELDALILPGGFGAANNLCSWATEGLRMHVEPRLERLILDLHAAGKPLGFMCIAPVIAAKLFGPKGVRLTVGNDAGTAARLRELGAVHVTCAVDEICVDQNLKIVTTPAYMLGPSIGPVSKGIDRLVSAVLELA
jgi:enhancing lycopene biosynthesis protein 2